MTIVLDKAVHGPQPCHLRPGTDDPAMWRDVVEHNEYGVDDQVAGRTVLDVGAGIGAFAVKALERGARLVVCVEPNPETCEALRRGLRSEILSGSVVAVEAAAWTSVGRRKLRLYHGGVRSGDTLVFSPPGEDVEVATVDFAGLVRAFAPEVVKVDCEGSEYEILREPLPPCVKLAWVEFHDTHYQPWLSRHRDIRGIFSDRGWTQSILKEMPGSGHRLIKFWR